MKQLPQITFFLIIIASAGFIGSLIGQNAMSPNLASQSIDMHSILHDKLHITSEQNKQIDGIEKEFKRLRTLYETKMKTANLELAQAIKEGGYKSPAIEIIIHKIHSNMGSLQSLTLDHLSKLKEALDNEQRQNLEDIVIEQLERNAE